MADPEAQPIGAVWPLLALRYGLIAAGVLAWLWEAGGAPGLAVGALLLSLVVALDLVLHGVLLPRGRSVWGAVQVALGIAVFIVSPGLPSAVILSAVLAGVAAATPRAVAVSCFIASTGVAIWESPLNITVGIVGLYVMGLTLGRLFFLQLDEIRRHRETVVQLERAQERVSRFAQTARDLAASTERQRIAEELHDAVGHALVGTLLQVQIAQRLVGSDPGAATKRLERVEASIRSTLEQVRAALRQGAQPGGRLPLHLALEHLVADFRAAGGPQVELSVQPDPESVSDVDPGIAEALYRTTQEALTNSVRHGHATCIHVMAEAVGRRIYLRISDNGVGADQYTPGMGLSGMVSRIQALGGTLRFQSAAGEGFRVHVGVTRR